MFNAGSGKSQDLNSIDYVPDLPYDKYRLVFWNTQNQPEITISYTIERQMTFSFLLYVGSFSAMFIALNAFWVVYLRPLKQKYKRFSIYE